jgi:hypothetical protein
MPVQQSVSDPGPECRDEVAEADRLADRYYSSFTKWLVQRRRSREDTRRLLGLGRAYDRALEFVIKCLDGLQWRSERAKRQRENAVALRTHLRDDLEHLEAVQADEG